MYYEMITTISLVNIHHLAEFQRFFFPLVMRTFKIYSLRNIQKTVLFTIVIPELIYLKTGSSYLLKTFPQFPHPYIQPLVPQI